MSAEPLAPARTAVLIVDMLKGFFGADDLPAGDVPGLDRILLRQRELIDAAHARGVPVVYVCDRYQPAERAFEHEFRHFAPHCVEGTPGADVLDELTPAGEDLVVVKKRFDGFFETTLDLLLRQMRVETTVLAGVHTDVCVQHTAAGAFFRGYRVAVAEDCCGSPQAADHARGLDYMRTWYAADVVRVADVVAGWDR